MNQSAFESVLSNLTRVFHSEADFQHHLAWQIRKHRDIDRLRLERRVTPQEIAAIDDDIYIDLWVDDGERQVPIELKYKTDLLRGTWQDEQFALKSQSAEDVSRFDFIWDIERIERIVDATDCSHGFAVMLTNDHLYWQEPTREDVVDYEFRLHEGNVLSGERDWAPGTSDGTKGELRDRSLYLWDEYELEWQDYEYQYPTDPEGNREFRYLLVKIDG